MTLVSNILTCLFLITIPLFLWAVIVPKNFLKVTRINKITTLKLNRLTSGLLLSCLMIVYLGLAIWTNGLAPANTTLVQNAARPILATTPSPAASGGKVSSSSSTPSQSSGTNTGDSSSNISTSTSIAPVPDPFATDTVSPTPIPCDWTAAQAALTAAYNAKENAATATYNAQVAAINQAYSSGGDSASYLLALSNARSELESAQNAINSWYQQQQLSSYC